ncbi:MAG: T9SS type A sorting domain-containing protein [Chloroherpetonaceae bacterium]|nr:T9SS type A sorting domain-containing protein [Chloroherpetonaceae bacterium]MCS7212354.1 T9SS type A sorting domain-containing protein [Chloroherpetonaceae bacterium]MDW8020376.1 T9SS type A sorting domain-containing protein [Chloroherpetonaceae bacterium]
MFKRYHLLLLLLLLLSSTDVWAQAQDVVRFSVNIRRLRQTGEIQAGDTLYALIFSGAGGRYSQPGDSTRIGVVSANANDTVYTGPFRPLGAANIGTITYKFTYRNLAAGRPLRFEDGDDRRVEFRQAAAETLTVSRYWNDNPSQGFPRRTRRVIFRADMSDLLASGFGAGDTIGVTGPFRDWTGTPPAMRRVGLTSTFVDTISITAEENSTVEWKFKAYSPTGGRFTNGGWEIGENRRFNFGTGTADLDATPTPLKPVIAIRVSRNFNVRVVLDTRGRRTLGGRSIDSLRAAGALRGDLNGLRYGLYIAGEGVFGAWPNWNDTSLLRNSNPPPPGQAIPAAQRFIFLDSSRTEPPGVFEAVIPATSTAFGPFKFSIFYRGIFDDPSPANGRLDNEGLVGADYLVNFPATIPVGSTATVRAVFAGGNASLSAPERDLSAPVARQYRLEQNYPNPFNPSTTIRFSIPTAENVQLDVFDVLGRKVATLVDQRLAAGTYTVQFNATNLSSGMYFYRISAGNFRQTMKMMLVK